MDYQFIQGISDIQETQAMAGSRTTLPFSPRNHEYVRNNQLQQYINPYSNISHDSQHQDQQMAINYSSLRDYVEKTLSSWGMKIGYLPENSENKYTIQVLFQLIKNKFREQESRQKLKDSLSETLFKSKQYQNLFQQEKTLVAQRNKTIGRLQNSLKQLKDRAKQAEIISKKERDDDKKMILMLKNKNEQILHEIKKRQHQTNRIKQQMKKNVGQKNTTKNLSFEVYEALHKDNNNQLDDKINAITEKYQNERRLLLKQNLLLRQKLYDIREEIVSFAEWVDLNLFKQKKVAYKNKFVINHNLLFKKQSIVQEFNQVIQNAKAGMSQLINMCQASQKGSYFKYNEKDEKSPLLSSQSKNYQQNNSPNKQAKQFIDLKRQQPRQTMPQMRKKSSLHFQPGKIRQIQSYKPKLNEFKRKNLQNPPQERNIDQESEISIISHISTKDIIGQNQNFNKWESILNDQ